MRKVLRPQEAIAWANSFLLACAVENSQRAPQMFTLECMTRTPTPVAYAPGTAHTTAEWAKLGVTRDMLRHQRFARVRWGVYRLRQKLPRMHLDQATRVLAQGVYPALRAGEVFSHTTALLLLNVPIRAPLEVHVTSPHHNNRTRDESVIGHRKRASFRTVYDHTRLPCIPTLDAVLQAAPLLTFCDLVVAFDHMLKLQGPPWRRYSISTKAAITTALASGNVPQAKRLRMALSVSRVGAESRMETLLHFELARMGLDDLEMQSEVFDAHGKLIGRFDLVDHSKKLILEYDGEQHRTDRDQYLHDEIRLQRARDAGYEVLRLHYEDFFAENLAQTRRTLTERLGRDPRPLTLALSRLFAECPFPTL